MTVWLDEVISGWWLGLDEEFRTLHAEEEELWWDPPTAERLWVAASGLWRACGNSSS